jgi:dinuclear metal center YbgI/SA1388 family protein
MRIRDIVAPLEEFAPLEYQESYDNSGLVVGSYDTEVEAALVCVDATEDVLDEAERRGCGLVISHHPIIFRPVKRFNGEGYVERVVERAIRSGIALYACHTNLDSTPGGMSFRVGEVLGLQDMQMLKHSAPGSVNGFGVVGTLAQATPTLDFLQTLRTKLNVKVVRHSEIHIDSVQRIALSTGAGADLIEAAKASGADVFVAADFKYNDFMLGDTGFIVADIGHFESEFCAIDLMSDIISKKNRTFAIHKSTSSHNPVNYLV